MALLVSLLEPEALKASVVGVKVARLARALQFGLPVVPGVVVPVTEGRDALERGVRALDMGRLGQARGAVFGTDTGALAEALATVASPGEHYVARSSTDLDDDGSLAGAFASFGDLEGHDLGPATRSCWASLFAPDSLERLRRIGRPPDEVGLAVLIQRQLHPTVGGWARMQDEAVEVAAVAGHPGRLLSGAEPGVRIQIIGHQRTATDDDRARTISDDQLDRLVEMARAAAWLLRADRIEWAFEEGDLYLLQANRLGTPATPAPTIRVPRPVALGDSYVRIARILVERRGSMADRLLLPWAGAGWSPHVAPITGSPEHLLRLLVRLAGELQAHVASVLGWNPLDALADDSVEDTLDRAARLASVKVDPGTGAAVLGAGQRLGEALVGQGLLDSPRALWRQTTEWLDAAVTSGRPPPPSDWRLWTRGDRILFDVCVAAGVTYQGVAASHGEGVGRAVRHSEGDPAAFQEGDVLVADLPRPDLAPLLWRASGLITAGGSAGAHLCEVARSLHVPTVVGIGPTPSLEASVVAVDGTSGAVHAWHGGQERPILPGFAER